jgi:hypothetical protein
MTVRLWNEVSENERTIRPTFQKFRMRSARIRSGRWRENSVARWVRQMNPRCTGNNSGRYSTRACGPSPQSGWGWQALRLGLERVFQRDRFGVRMEVTRQGYQRQPLSFFLVVVVVGVVALEGDTLGDINGNTGSRLVPVQSLG